MDFAGIVMAVITGKKRKNKYNAIKCELDGIKFDSIKEKNYYQQLQILKKAGEVSYFLRQVPLHLPGKTVLRIDFLVFYSDGRIEYIDVKGFVTPMAKLKKRQAEEIYPIEVKYV